MGEPRFFCSGAAPPQQTNRVYVDILVQRVSKLPRMPPALAGPGIPILETTSFLSFSSSPRLKNVDSHRDEGRALEVAILLTVVIFGFCCSPRITQSEGARVCSFAVWPAARRAAAPQPRSETQKRARVSFCCTASIAHSKQKHSYASYGPLSSSFCLKLRH